MKKRVKKLEGIHDIDLVVTGRHFPICKKKKVNKSKKR